MNPRHTFQVGGMANPKRHVVLPRPELAQIEALVESREPVIVCGPRQTGKTTTAFQAVLSLRAKGWSGIIIDLTTVDASAAETSGLEAAVVMLLASTLEGQECGLSTVSTLLDAFDRLARHGDVIVVFDEMQSVGKYGAKGQDFLAKVRSLQQRLVRNESAGGHVVPVFVLLSVSRYLYAPSEGEASSSRELLGSTVRLGPIASSPQLVDTLASHFKDQDPDGASHIAQELVHASRGYPVLLMAMSRRAREENIKFGPEFRSWLSALPSRFRRSQLESSFLETTERFFQDDTLSRVERRDALWVYEELLRRGPPLPYDDTNPEMRLLLDSGLTYLTADERLDHLGSFMTSYFDVQWARSLRHRLDQATAAKPGTPLSSQRRLFVILTGGTIGMLEQDGAISPDLRSEYEELGQRFNLVGPPLSLLNLDGANVGPSEWSRIARAIAENLSACDGVVVAGGTDTLAYTASAVALALGEKLNKPVVFTGSQTTADIPWGDARSNLLRACLVACAPDSPADLAEVVVSFGDQIIRAVRANKRDDQSFQGFESLGFPSLGSVSERVKLNSELCRSVARVIPVDEHTVRDNFASGVLVVSQSPGLQPAFLVDALRAELNRHADERRVRGIIVSSLGAGNIPTSSSYGLQPLIGLASENDIPVVLSSRYPSDVSNMGRYGPPLEALEAGAIPVANMTEAALIAKLSWSLAETDGSTSALAEYMWTDFVGEVNTTDSEALRSIYYSRGR